MFKVQTFSYSQPGGSCWWISIVLDLSGSFQQGRRSIQLTFIHAPTNYQQCLLVWKELRQIHSTNTLPLICAGDFDELRYPWEKMGKRPANQSRMMSFRAVLNDCAFTELESNGCKYTWMNNREGEELVKEKLDRVVCTMEWQFLFPGAEIYAFSAVRSDHSPILINTSESYPKTRKPFLF